MSSNNFDDTIELSLQPSVRAVMALFWGHTIPLVLLLIAPLQQGVMTALVLAIGASWWWLRRHPAFGYGPKALTRLVWHPDGAWLLETTGGERYEAQLGGSSIVLRFVLVLNFSVSEGGRRTRILLGDELDGAVLQRLHARLNAASGPV